MSHGAFRLSRLGRGPWTSCGSAAVVPGLRPPQECSLFFLAAFGWAFMRFQMAAVERSCFVTALKSKDLSWGSVDST